MTQNTQALSKKIPDETSKRITALRFLLIILVVFIHNNFLKTDVLTQIENGTRPADFIFAPNAFSEYVQYFISQGIARAAVPIFFMISAYLQFTKNDSYKVLLKKRSKNLILPYFLWIIINIAMMILLNLFFAKVMPSALQTTGKIVFIADYSVTQWFEAFFGKYSILKNHISDVAGPYLIQFWFVRDLFIMMILSPILTKVARRFPIELLTFATFFFVTGFRPFFVHSQAFLFYLIGFYWAEYDFDIFAFADKCKMYLLLPLFVFFVVLNKIYNTTAINTFRVFVSIIILLKFSKFLVNNEKCFALTKFLAPYSFFLFAVHVGALLTLTQTIWLKFFPMKNGFFCLAEYFCVSILIIFFGTLIGIILNKIAPKLFKILNGGR